MVNTKMYQEFKNKPNFQAMADTNMGKLIAAQQRKIDNQFLPSDTHHIKPSNLYQQYLKQSGILPSYRPPKDSYCKF